MYFSPFHFFNYFSLSRTNTCFSYLNFKHLISFVIPGYERWDDSAIWKVQLSTGFWLGFHNISSCPWHIHGTCRNGHHMPSQICLGKTWFSLCLNMGCKSSFCRTTCRTSFCRNFMSFMYLLFWLVTKIWSEKKFHFYCLFFLTVPFTLPSKHLPVFFFFSFSFFFFQFKFVWNFLKISCKVTKRKGNFQMIKKSLCGFCLCL